MVRAVLLDRDGVINVNRDPYVLGPDDLALIPGCASAIAQLNRRDYRVLVITNQACVASGLVTQAGLAAIHEHLAALLAKDAARIDGHYVCPHAKDAGCRCRKPAPELLERAQAEWGFVPSETWFVGDKIGDVAAARAAGCRPALVCSGVWQGSPVEPEVAVHADLAAFVGWLLSCCDTV